MVEIKLETGNNTTDLGNKFLWIIIAFLVGSALFALLAFLMFFFIYGSGGFS